MAMHDVRRYIINQSNHLFLWLKQQLFLTQSLRKMEAAVKPPPDSVLRFPLDPWTPDQEMQFPSKPPTPDSALKEPSTRAEVWTSLKSVFFFSQHNVECIYL